jgi:bifunctional enzyme CysN/CysC
MVKAEVDRGLVLNQIGSIAVSTARPIIFDRYRENRGTGSFILIDPTTNFTAGAGMIAEPLGGGTQTTHRPSAAERLARAARGASSDAEAIEAVRKALEELLS